MSKFQLGDFVKHKESDYHIFEVLFEMKSVPRGGTSLYECHSLDDRDGELKIYHENDLYKVDLSQEEIEAHRARMRRG
jgi:hypothetical protein